MSVNKKYPSSQRAIVELIRAVKGGGDFSNSDHLLVIKEERHEGQKNRIMQMTPDSRL